MSSAKTPLVQVPAALPSNAPPPSASAAAPRTASSTEMEYSASHSVAVPAAAPHGGGHDAHLLASAGTAVPPAYGSAAAPPAAMSMTRIRITFGLFLLFGFVASLLLQFQTVMWIFKWVIEKGMAESCAIKTGLPGLYQCMAAQGVYRVSFALFVFFLLHYMLSHRQNLCLEPESRVALNQGYFIIKLVLLVGFMLLCFIIPNEFFVFYAWLCFALSIIYLIAQLLVLIEFAYAWSEDWSSREDDRYQKGLLACTVGMIVGSIVLLSLCFKWFGYQSECGGNQAAIALTLIAGLFYLAVSVQAGKGAIVPASVVFIYTSWTCFCAISSSGDEACQGTIGASTNTQLVLSSVFTAVSLIVSTLSAATSRDAFSLDDMTETGAEGDAMMMSHFHGIMVLASAYLAMLVTNWTIVGSTSMASIYGVANHASLGAKLGSEALCVVLFLTTLIAPYCCKGREFDKV